jgi:hypothetical protein
LEKGFTYYWTASVEGEEGGDRKAFHLATNSEYKAILSALESSGPEAELPSAKAFRLAFMLEQAHYPAEAYTYYKKATALEPEGSLYKSTLESFKKDYGL